VGDCRGPRFFGGLDSVSRPSITTLIHSGLLWLVWERVVEQPHHWDLKPINLGRGSCSLLRFTVGPVGRTPRARKSLRW
jgi:hypothetical protein